MDDWVWYFLGGAALWLFLNAVALRRFSGWWRTAAFVPAALMALATGVTVLAALDGSNLAPIWLILAIPFCLALTGMLWTIRLIATAWRSRQAPRREPASRRGR